MALVAHSVGLASDKQPSPQVAVLAFHLQPAMALQADCEVAAVAHELVQDDDPDEAPVELTRQLGLRWHAASLDESEHCS